MGGSDLEVFHDELKGFQEQLASLLDELRAGLAEAHAEALRSALRGAHSENITLRTENDVLHKQLGQLRAPCEPGCVPQIHLPLPSPRPPSHPALPAEESPRPLPPIAPPPPPPAASPPPPSTAPPSLSSENGTVREENDTLHKGLQPPCRAAVPGGFRPVTVRPGTPVASPPPLPNVVISDESTASSTGRLSFEVADCITKTGGAVRPSIVSDDGFSRRRSSYMNASGAWSVWLRLSDEAPTPRYSELAAVASVKESLARWRLRVTDLENQPEGGCSGMVLHPSSGFVCAWTVLSCILLAYDAVMIPMAAGLTMPSEFKVIDGIIAVYWALDLIRTFFTGYEDNSITGIEMGLWPIARRYGKTWFGLDLALVVLDVVLTFTPEESNVGASANTSRASRAARVWRLVRVARLMRVLKHARRVWAQVQGWLSLQQILAMKACYVIGGVLLVCHYVACYWCALDSFANDQVTTWKTEMGLENPNAGDLYLIAVTWALAQSGFCSSNIYATNSPEHLYATIVSFVWLVVVSVTITFFHTWACEAREAKMEEKKEQEQEEERREDMQAQEGFRLRNFLDQRDCSRNLSMKILRYFRFNYNAHVPRLVEEDIKFLKFLPIGLQIRLHRELHHTVLRQHPFFSLLGTEHEAALVAICHLTTTEFRYVSGETVFREGKEASYMFYVIKGKLDYYTHKAGALGTRIADGDWSVEPALWLHWVHCGRLVAAESTEMLAVDVTKVRAVVEEVLDCDGHLTMLRRHARKALAFFFAIEPASRTDLDCVCPRPRPARINVEAISHVRTTATCWEETASSDLFRSSVRRLRTTPTLR